MGKVILKTVDINGLKIKKLIISNKAFFRLIQMFIEYPEQDDALTKLKKALETIEEEEDYTFPPDDEEEGEGTVVLIDTPFIENDEGKVDTAEEQEEAGPAVPSDTFLVKDMAKLENDWETFKQETGLSGIYAMYRLRQAYGELTKKPAPRNVSSTLLIHMLYENGHNLVEIRNTALDVD